MATTYIVMRRSERAAVNTVLYELMGTWHCNGPEQAIRALAEGAEGEFVAVPQRNWTRVLAEREEVKPRLVLRETDAIPTEDVNLTMGGVEDDDRDEMTVEAAQLAETHAP